MGLTLEEALARVPFFVSAKNVKTAPLTGGITNLNYKVEADGKAYVLRITGADTDLLGISRDVEYAANLAAGRLGVAPEVMYFIEPEGYLVTRFVNGKKIPPTEITRPENIRRLARKLRVFHKNAPELPGEFNVFRRIEMLSRRFAAIQLQVPFRFRLDHAESPGNRAGAVEGSIYPNALS